jgi:hypothetical protein
MATTPKPRQLPLPGFKYVFRASITTRSGRTLYARNYGLRAWPILVKDE